MRNEFASHFAIDPAKPSDADRLAPFEEDVTGFTVHGITLAIVDGIPGQPCSVAALFTALLEKRKLPRFAFAFRGHNNCFAITQQLYFDFKDLGIEHRFTYREGFSSVLQANGEPIGRHRWIELDGWAIDASGGALGNPVLFERADDYYSKRAMTDIRDVAPDGDQLTTA